MFGVIVKFSYREVVTLSFVLFNFIKLSMPDDNSVVVKAG